MAFVFITLSLLHPLRGLQWSYLPQEPGLCPSKKPGCGPFRLPTHVLWLPGGTEMAPPALGQLNRASQAKSGLSLMLPRAQT